MKQKEIWNLTEIIIKQLQMLIALIYNLVHKESLTSYPYKCKTMKTCIIYTKGTCLL